MTLQELERGVSAGELIGTLHDIEDVYTCTPTQEGILLAHVQHDDQYAVQTIMDVRSVDPQAAPIDMVKLADAWRALVCRHPILRTFFLQVTSHHSRSFLQAVLRKYSPDIILRTFDHREDALAFLKSEPRKPFRFAFPGYDLWIVQATDGSTLCRLDISHALVDATTLRLIWNEWSQAHSQQLSSAPATPYADFIRYFNTQSERQALQYWTEYLSEVRPCLLLTLADDFGIENDAQHDFVFSSLPQADELHEFCKANEATVANVFQVAWAVVLGTFSGEDSVCFGFLASGRDAPIKNVYSIAGPLISMLVCQLNISPGTSISHLLDTVREDVIKGLSHQAVSLGEIHHALGLNTSRLFNTILSVQSVTKVDADSEAGLSFHKLSEADPTEYDLSATAVGSHDKIQVSLGFRKQRVLQAQAQNIADTFIQVVKSISTGNIKRVEDIQLCSKKKTREHLVSGREFPAKIEKCLHEIVRSRVLALPNEQAVYAWDGQLSYSQLDELSSRLASYIIRQDAKRKLLFGFASRRVCGLLSQLWQS